MRPEALASLRELGMATDRITWEDSIEQSASVSHVDHQTARDSDDLPDPQHLIDFRPVPRGGFGGGVRSNPPFCELPFQKYEPHKLPNCISDTEFQACPLPLYLLQLSIHDRPLEALF